MGRIFVLYKLRMILIVLWNGHLARDQYLWNGHLACYQYLWNGHLACYQYLWNGHLARYQYFPFPILSVSDESRFPIPDSPL